MSKPQSKPQADPGSIPVHWFSGGFFASKHSSTPKLNHHPQAELGQTTHGNSLFSSSP